MCPFRPNPLAPFPAREGGKFGRVLPSPLRRGLRERLTPKPKQTLSPRGWAKGGRGRSPSQGDVPPKFSNKGRVANSCQPHHEWDPKPRRTPSPRGWAKRWSRGRSPLAGGLGDVPPKIQKRGRVVHLSNPTHEWDPKPWRTPSLRGWAKRGSRGRSPLAGGIGGCAPKNSKEGAGCPP